MAPSPVDAWHPSPAKRTLLELAQFRYLFGNTRHTSFFRPTTSSTSNRIALLGFGDLRNAWATINNANAAGCAQLEADLVDIQLGNVARGVLLDYLALNLDIAGNEEDALFLWGVTYCATLPSHWLPRLQSFIKQLLDDETAPFESRFGRSEDAVAVRTVMQSWFDLDTGFPTVGEVEKTRLNHIAAWLTHKKRNRVILPGEESEIDPEWEGMFGAMAVQIAAGLQTSSFSKLKTKAAEKECKEYLRTGSIYPTALETILSAQKGSQAQGGSAKRVANPTLLDPGTWEWRLHYGAAPFLSYLPLSPQGERAAVAAIASKESSTPLTTACFEEFRALAMGRQKSGNIGKMRFWLGDALELCTDGALPLGAYSSIDTSNLADNVGLLTILAVCQPLLLPDVHAALFTTTMTWATSGARTLVEYLDLALGGIDMRLSPTLLGLRLLTPVEFGREIPRSRLTNMVSDMLMWQPVVQPRASLPAAKSSDRNVGGVFNTGENVATAPLPRFEDSSDLRKGLQALAKVCTGQRARDKKEPLGRCGLQMGTTMTLLHLLRSLSERVQGVLPPIPSSGDKALSSASSWRLVAEHTAALCQLPASHRTQWDALICWCFGEKESPRLLSWKLDPVPHFKSLVATFSGHIPSLEAIVMTPTINSNPMAMLSSVMSGRADVKSMVQQERLDVVGFEPESFETRCLVPPFDANSSYESMGSLVIVDSSNDLDLPAAFSVPKRIKTMKITEFKSAPPPRLAGDVWRSAEQSAVHAAAEICSLRNLRVIKATESAAGYHFSFEVQAEANLKSPQGPGSKTSGPSKPTVKAVPLGSTSTKAVPSTQLLELSLKQPPCSASVSLPWPVEKTGYIAQLRAGPSASTGVGSTSGMPLVDLTLRKSWIWPQDDQILQKVRVENLPEATLSEIGNHMGTMFSLEEGMRKLPEHKARGASSSRGSTLFNLKESIQVFFLFTKQKGYKGRMMHQLIDPGQRPFPGADADEPYLTLVVHSILKLPDGRPLAHISYVDHARAWNMLSTEAQKNQAGVRLGAMIRSAGVDKVGMNSVKCVPGEVPLLKRLLARNAQSLVMPTWQKKVVEEGPEWEASFLLPLYSGELFLWKERKKEMYRGVYIHMYFILSTGYEDL